MPHSGVFLFLFIDEVNFFSVSSQVDYWTTKYKHKNFLLSFFFFHFFLRKTNKGAHHVVYKKKTIATVYKSVLVSLPKEEERKTDKNKSECALLL